jgi:hypothetical protein
MEQKSNGSLISAIIIIIILIIGGIYFWKSGVKNAPVNNSNYGAPTGSVQGTADQTAAIEQDLNKVDTNNLDSGL